MDHVVLEVEFDQDRGVVADDPADAGFDNLQLDTASVAAAVPFRRAKSGSLIPIAAILSVEDHEVSRSGGQVA